jgi:uracil-DNA glycosylase
MYTSWKRANFMVSQVYLSIAGKLWNEVSCVLLIGGTMSFFKNNLIGIDSSWGEFFKTEAEKPYISGIESLLFEERQKGSLIYPPPEQTFSAFQTPLDQVKVVIVGQDPYHGPGQAHGLAFSVSKGIPIPPSLKNIFQELQTDLKIPIPSHGSLVSWAKQGVLLLNATLTVRKNEPKSHFGRGWELFTDAVIRTIYSRQKPVVFLLWGRSAIDKLQQLQTSKEKHPHLILTAPHPSPFSAYSGFFGCAHFSKTNTFLKNSGLTPIDWKIL